jgi:hypothetical protein
MAITYDSIQTTTLGTAASPITLSSIPASYTDLKLVFKWKSNGAGGTNCIPTLRANNDTAANYNVTYMNAGANSRSGGNLSAKSRWWSTAGSATAGSTYWYSLEVDFMDYASTTRPKNVYIRLNMASPSGNIESAYGYGIWSGVAAINRIDIDDNIFGNSWVAGSWVALYGITRA